MLLSGLTQHSMTPLLHYSNFSFNHSIRSRYDVGWNGDTDLVCGLEIDREIKLGRLH